MNHCHTNFSLSYIPKSIMSKIPRSCLLMLRLSWCDQKSARVLLLIMARIIKSCMQSILKGVNSIMAMVGISMILYGVWMVRVWQRDMGGSSFDDFNSTSPWFIYTFLVTGICLCLLTCLGHIAADSANGFCLFWYMVIISVLLLVETGIAADILLNSDWEKDLPEDPTGRFHDFKEFVQSNIDIFKSIGLIIILGQGLSVLSAMALRALGPNQCSNYDSDEEFLPARLPLINNHAQQPVYAIGDSPFPNKNEAWNIANK
ncbi:tetraspanin-19-like isoform X2 [Durio zibethinus]|uniref:Tetraspanin-19-like isoform X2 n=1 Tax=Durio zibethinus TaxID=66656 RepID=A0A6P5WY96_DURZI|nr:tetraspanin-19-like isoform X2 [Durio zibethinus]